MGNQLLHDKAASKGAAYLDEWARLLSAMAARAIFEVDEDRRFTRCSVIIPSRGRVEGEGDSVEEATSKLAQKIQQVIASINANDWPAEWHQLANSVEVRNRADHHYDASLIRKNIVGRTASKERQETIGVSCKRSLQTFISGCAESKGESAAQIARMLLSQGFEEFEERRLSHSASRVFASFQKDYDRLGGADTSQWMVRTNPSLFVRIRLTAKEHGKSASQLSAMCMAHALVMQQVTELELEKAHAQVQAVQGPAVRKLSNDIGLGKNSALLSGVLSGRTEAPSKVLQALSDRLQVAALALAESFRRSFALNTVPAFKAGDGKPVVHPEPQSWSDAVASLKLSSEEAQALLELAD
jgi:hypothetical protein